MVISFSTRLKEPHKQFNGLAHDQTPTSHCTQQTRTVFTVSVLETPTTRVQVLASQTRTAMDLLLLSELISISHLATTLLPVSKTTRKTPSSLQMETALKDGSTLLTCSMKFTGTHPSLLADGLQVKANNLSFSLTVTQLVTVCTPISSPDGIFQPFNRSLTTVMLVILVWISALA